MPKMSESGNTVYRKYGTQNLYASHVGCKRVVPILPTLIDVSM